MSIEAVDLKEQHPKPENRIEKLLKRIDAKAEVISDLRGKIESQSIPLLSDSPEAIHSENIELRSVIFTFMELFPDDFEAYNIREALGDLLFDFENGEVVDIEYDKAKKDYTEIDEAYVDIDFVEFVNEGVEGLIDRRKRLRRFQVIWGEPGEDGFYQTDLHRFDQLQELKEIPDVPDDLGRFITRVNVSSYGINIFIDEKIYSGIKHFHEVLESSGIHFDNSLINILSDSDFDDKMYGFDFIGFQLAENLQHEEFHAIEDAFENGNPDFKFLCKAAEDHLYRANAVASTTEEVVEQHIQNDVEISDRLIAREIIDRNRRLPEEIDLTDIPDSSHEELLAEMYSKEKRKGIPSSTYSIYSDQKKDLLSKFTESSVLDELGIDVITKPMLSSNEFRQRMDKLYGRVLEHIPERIKRVDALFVFILPDQFSLIEKTVERWIEEKREVQLNS